MNVCKQGLDLGKGKKLCSHYCVCVFPLVSVNECSSEPCLYNSLCEDLLDGFVCHCENGLYGTLCQYGM